GPLDRGEDADRRRESRRAHARQQIRERGIRLVVDQEVLLRHVASERDHLGAIVAQANALVPALPEDEGLAVLEDDRVVGLAVLLRLVTEGAVVEDVTVLKNLHER